MSRAPGDPAARVHEDDAPASAERRGFLTYLGGIGCLLLARCAGDAPSGGIEKPYDGQLTPVRDGGGTSVRRYRLR